MPKNIPTGASATPINSNNDAIPNNVGKVLDNSVALIAAETTALEAITGAIAEQHAATLVHYATGAALNIEVANKLSALMAVFPYSQNRLTEVGRACIEQVSQTVEQLDDRQRERQINATAFLQSCEMRSQHIRQSGDQIPMRVRDQLPARAGDRSLPASSQPPDKTDEVMENPDGRTKT